MTGAEVKAIREALGEALGQRLSQQDLGLMLGLAPKNAGDTVRKWEDSVPTGPAAVALLFMAQGTRLATYHAPYMPERIRDIILSLTSPAPSQQ
jgi:DNA-binding transcriptional regulator YiaG